MASQIDSFNDAEAFMGKDAARIFEEVLDAEVFVNLDKVRNAARRGIPKEHRSRLYRFLLGVTPFDKSSEMTFRQRRGEDFSLLCLGSGKGRGNVVSGSLSGVWGAQRALLRSGKLIAGADGARRMCYERVLEAFEVSQCTATHEEVRVIVTLSLAFEAVFDSPQDIFFATDALLSLLRTEGNVLASSDWLQDHCSRFLALLHATNEELYQHLVSEGVSPFCWVPSMLQTLLAGHLPMEELLRLWDTYITDASTSGNFRMHIYVCLAVLEEHTEVMSELASEELLQQLRFFDRIDMEATLRRASSIREDVRSRGLIVDP